MKVFCGEKNDEKNQKKVRRIEKIMRRIEFLYLKDAVNWCEKGENGSFLKNVSPPRIGLGFTT